LDLPGQWYGKPIYSLGDDHLENILRFLVNHGRYPNPLPLDCTWEDWVAKRPMVQCLLGEACSRGLSIPKEFREKAPPASLPIKINYDGDPIWTLPRPPRTY
jgi:hypothetical protein